MGEPRSTPRPPKSRDSRAIDSTRWKADVPVVECQIVATRSQLIVPANQTTRRRSSFLLSFVTQSKLGLFQISFSPSSLIGRKLHCSFHRPACESYVHNRPWQDRTFGFLRARSRSDRALFEICVPRYREPSERDRGETKV